MPGPHPRLSLPFAQWPVADRNLWTAATSRDDPFDDAPGARLAKTTLHSRWMAWRRFLGFLTLVEPDALKLPAAKRLTTERVRNYARHLGETNTPYSVGCQVDAFYGAVRIMLPKGDWDWLRTMKKRLFAAAPSRRPRGPVITSVQLIDLGFELMAEAKIEAGQKPLSMKAAILYRDGLMIALVGYMPFRHKNFAALQIGRELVKEDGGWYFVVPPEDTKTHVPIDFDLPQELRESLEIYLRLVRPRLLRQSGCKALWVSAKGGPLSYSAVGPVVTRHTTERLGIRIAPHDARDAAVTFWAIVAPAQIGIARDLLTHESPPHD